MVALLGLSVPVSVAGAGETAACVLAPAGTDAPTGGDLYGWFPLPDGTVHITLVDALGHGVRSTGAALNVTRTARTLALGATRRGPSSSGRARSWPASRPRLLATVLLARVDPEGGEVLLAHGSHPPAAQLHEWLTPAQLLKVPPEDWAADWATADPDRFAAA